MLSTQRYACLKPESATGLKLTDFQNCLTLFFPKAREGSPALGEENLPSPGKKDYLHSSFIEIIDFYCMTIPLI